MRHAYIETGKFGYERVVCCGTRDVLMSGIDSGQGRQWALSREIAVVDNLPPHERSTFVQATVGEDGILRAVWTLPED